MKFSKVLRRLRASYKWNGSDSGTAWLVHTAAIQKVDFYRKTLQITDEQLADILGFDADEIPATQNGYAVLDGLHFLNQREWIKLATELDNYASRSEKTMNKR